MRRLFGVIILCSSLALLAAGPSTPPSSQPAAAVTPTPQPVDYVPSVVIYPFGQTPDMQAKVGLAIAQIFAQVIASQPGVKVAAIGEKVERADYVTYAQAQKADYYISGYLTPIGGGAAVVVQIVDVSTGIIKYSQSQQIFSANDAGSLALTARSVIIEASGEAEQAVISQNATPAPSETNGSQVSLGRISGAVDSLFKHSGKGAPIAAVTMPPKPSRSIIVTRVGGTASAGQLTLASQALMKYLSAYYVTRKPAITVTNAVSQADSICGTDRNNTIAMGTLSQVQQGNHYHSYVVSTFTLDVFTCFGAKLYESTQQNQNLSDAVQKAVDDYQTAFPDNS